MNKLLLNPPREKLGGRGGNQTQTCRIVRVHNVSVCNFTFKLIDQNDNSNVYRI